MWSRCPSNELTRPLCRQLYPDSFSFSVCAQHPTAQCCSRRCTRCQARRAHRRIGSASNERPTGLSSSYLCEHVHAGDILEVSAPRGGFILRSGDAPVVLLSAGIGATPVLAMLHSLSSAASLRVIWWIYGARSRAEHPFAKESRELLQTLVNSRSHIVYNKPDSQDKAGVDYDSIGHVDAAAARAGRRCTSRCGFLPHAARHHSSAT